MDFANTQEMDTEAASKSKEPLEDAESSKPPLLSANFALGRAQALSDIQITPEICNCLQCLCMRDAQ